MPEPTKKPFIVEVAERTRLTGLDLPEFRIDSIAADTFVGMVERRAPAGELRAFAATYKHALTILAARKQEAQRSKAA